MTTPRAAGLPSCVSTTSPLCKSAARRDKDAGKLRAKWVGQRCQVAVAAAGGDGVRLARVLACVGVFILQLRRLRVGASVFDLSVSVSPPATSEGPGPLRRKQKQNVFKRFSGLWALK